ncbi:MAG: hypothetical protein K0R64_2388 [Novosphingobium lindaniclasticum]|jgi:hypothetical protein|uniref:DUF3618 domain-containing protein n=1 Tax=Novosphingobium lindaniclasticum TaxID=1329895 RepID=UPI00240A8B57|nr:DUF3618 domain-containing protein [Novosphingobium lindaniclasticum]MDF2639404.1 hypothetical protein [Novosphingobium lindaniclasticum]
MTDQTHQDPAEIERDIRRTQEQMSRTVDAIGDQLTPRNLLNALLDKAESNNVDARMLLDGARRNPLALAMIAGGAIWLVSENDAKLPKIERHKHEPSSGPGVDPHHRDYISHMERVEARDGEDAASYQRRRDAARANYFMVERSHDDDDHSFRDKLDKAAEAFRNRRHAWSDSAAQAGKAVAGGSRTAVEAAATKGQQLYSGNPLIGGLVAAAAGAFLGSLLPESEAEQQALGSIGERARGIASEQTNQLMSTAREKKDDLVAAAQESVASSESNERQGAETGPQPTLPI